MGEESGISADDPGHPVASAPRSLAQTLELDACPADQEGIDTGQRPVQCRLVEVTVVVDPTLDVRIEHPGQVVQGFVAPMMERPPSDRLPDCLQRFRAGCGQE